MKTVADRFEYVAGKYLGCGLSVRLGTRSVSLLKQGKPIAEADFNTKDALAVIDGQFATSSSLLVTLASKAAHLAAEQHCGKQVT